jgi:hypothetical protein
MPCDKPSEKPGVTQDDDGAINASDIQDASLISDYHRLKQEHENAARLLELE